MLRMRICLILLILNLPAFGQISPEKLAMGRMEKGKWAKVEQTLRKSLSKDSLNPEARYLLALYFFNAVNPSYQLDSAYSYARSTTRNLQLVSVKERERLKKIPLDSNQLLKLRVKIDSASFEYAKRLNTEESYQYFIDHRKGSLQLSAAVELRDEVAYIDALKVNTWSSFQKFLIKYPSSVRINEAKRRFDKLLFEDKTGDHKLSSFIAFHKQFPKSPYRSITEKSILEMSTASGSPESFQWFIENYPSGSSAIIAKNILYKLQTTDDENIFDENWMTDSLRSMEKLNKSYWVPIIKSGKFGFMDEHGVEVIAPLLDDIAEDYRCGEITERLLVTSAGLLARDGSILWNGKLKEAKEIGMGYLLLTSDSGNFVMHESGFRIGSFVMNAQPVASRFLALQKSNKWGLFSLTGKQLLPYNYDDINAIDSLIVLERMGKKVLTTPSLIAKINGRSSLNEDFVFEDVKRWAPRQYWVRNGSLEGVIDPYLNFVIPLDRQRLRKATFGFIQQRDGKEFVKGIKKFENIPYKSIQEQAGWVRLQTENNRSQLYDKALTSLYEGDSVWFKGQLAMMQINDSLKAFLPAGQKLSFSENTYFQLKEYRDSSAWVIVDDRKRKTVYDAASGIKLFTLDFDDLEAISNNVFLVTRLNKKGLLTEEGKVLIPIEYDAIVSVDSTQFSLLKEKKFGWYDLKRKILIRPVFDRNIKFYNSGLRIAYKDKFYGFITLDGRPSGNFDWEEIQYWNDSTALVKKNFQWMLMNIHSRKISMDRIRNFTVIKDTSGEKIYIVKQDNAFGVISSKHGIVVPIQYSDVINLGSKDMPLYFTERHIEEAGISVVIYYDHLGKIIRKQALEAEEFEEISCNN